MEMDKLYGSEWKVEMCPDPSHLGLWKMEKLHGLGQKLEMCPDPSHLEISKFNQMQILWALINLDGMGTFSCKLCLNN